MRRIKFRAWDSVNVRMFPVSGIWFSEDGNHRILEISGNQRTESPLEGNGEYPKWIYLMQYTNLIDKNGKEIYESDLLKGFSRTSGPLEVQFFDGHYELHMHKDASASVHRHCLRIGNKLTVDLEVVGNIYENPTIESGG